MAKKLTSTKARKILHDKEVHGKPLTEKQRKFFGAIAGGAKPYKAESGGWLDKYDEGGVLKQKKEDNYGVQGNYNNYDISLPDGFKGWAYNLKGRNYSPAWGGQFQDGGNLMPAMAGANQTVPMAQAGIRQPITTNLEDYKRWQDSVANYQKGLKELAETRQKTKTNINNYSLSNPTNLVSSFGNLLFGDDKGKRRIKPTYKEISVPKSTGWYDAKSLEQQPMNYVAIGDPFFGTEYDLSKVGVKAEFDDDRNSLSSKTFMYSPYGNFVALYHPPVRQNLLYQEPKKGVSSKSQPKPPRKLEKLELKRLETPKIEPINVRPSITQPKFEQIKVDEQKPTKYSYTYPTGKYLEHKTIYFPNRNSWKTFVEQQKGVSSQEGKDYGSATGQFQMGGSLPGAVGFMYARTQSPAPSNGPYAKKTKASAQNGQEMKYYQEGLDFKPKTISQDGVAIDPMGYWNPDNVGNPVIIPSNIITMEGVDQPLMGISDTGDVQYMEPGQDYEFDGEYVTEYPVAKGGVSVNNADAQPIKKLDQLLNFTNYNKPTKGGWLDKYK